MQPTIYLASQSPRRRELVRLLGYAWSCLDVDVDERVVAESDPAANAANTAALKATAARSLLAKSEPPAGALTLAADTVVSLGRTIMGKPADADEARMMLRALRNRDHHVHTGFVLEETRAGRVIGEVHTAVVTMRGYSDAELERYVQTGDPLDKAGGYAIQHPEFQPVARLHGCFLGVMGLSVCHLLHALRRLQVNEQVDRAALFAAHQGYSCPLYEAL